MGTSSTAYIMTISNSIIGVSVLAMPFCYKQCGIVLSCLMLLLSNILSRATCHFLLKSAIMSRRRNYELLAFHVFGAMGKTFVEISIIGFMMGTCIAFFVVMGDLGPAILSNIFTHIRIETLRPTVLMGIAIFIVLPLGLLRNVESLSAVSTATILFYLCLVLKMVAESSTNLLQGDWVYEVKYWNPAGLLQCLPIFSMALFCQSQLFDIFESTPNLSLDQMNKYIGSAVNMCTGVYMSVGLFGYVAYYKLSNLSGNVLLSFSPNASSEIIKLGFVLSVAVSFPLVIFPCRASIYSFLFKKGHSPHYEAVTHNAMAGGSSHHIPESRFRCITLFIIFISLLTALMATNIELVLGLVGATIGVLICVLLPSYIFVTVSGKHTSERLFAKVIFVVGLAIMFLGTYANLRASEKQEQVTSLPSMFIVQEDGNKGEIIKLAQSMQDKPNFILQDVDNKIEKPNLPGSKPPEINEMRQEYDRKLEKEKNEREKRRENLNRKIEEKVNKENEMIGQLEESKKVLKTGFGVESSNNGTKLEEISNVKGNRMEELINKEAIRKDDKEAQNEIAATPKAITSEMKNHEMEILEKLKKQEEEQKKIMIQQEAILKEVIKQNKQLEEIKAKDDAKDEAQLKASAKGSMNLGENINNGKEDANIGSGLVSHSSPDKSVHNNLISEKIQELNENIKELNRDEIQLTNQIDKVKDNILREDTPGNKPNENVDTVNTAIDSKNIIDTALNQNIGNAGRGNDGAADKFDKPIVGQMAFSKSPEANIPIEVDKTHDEKSAVNRNINNIESPPNKVGKVPLGNPNVLNEEFIEVEKDLNYKKNVEKGIEKKTYDEKKPLNSVPIALMLQPSNKPESKPSDVIKTRDILETVQREKRDVRQEPANPIPPEYDVARSPDPFQALKESVQKDIKAFEEEERKTAEDNVDKGSKHEEDNKEELDKNEVVKESVKTVETVDKAVHADENNVKDDVVVNDNNDIQKEPPVESRVVKVDTIKERNVKGFNKLINKTSDMLGRENNHTGGGGNDKSINDAIEIITKEALSRHDSTSNPPSDEIIPNKNDIVHEPIPNDLNANSSEMSNLNIDNIVPNQIRNEVVQTVDEVGHRDDNIGDSDRNVNEDKNVIQIGDKDFKSTDSIHKISDIKVLKDNNNQNEKCDSKDKSSEGIRVPQLFSNLDHPEVLSSLQLDNLLKSQVINSIVADKAVKR